MKTQVYIPSYNLEMPRKERDSQLVARLEFLEIISDLAPHVIEDLQGQKKIGVSRT